MEASVSVLVICNEIKYLTRCLNSLKRQIVKPCEIILISDVDLEDNYSDEKIGIIIESSENIYNSLNLALNKVLGSYVFICNAGSDITENTLKELLFSAENDGKHISAAEVFYPEKDGFKKSNPYLSIYGKLFRTDIIKSEGIGFPSDSSFGEFQFLEQYLENTNGIKYCAGTGLYESKSESLLSFGQTIYQYEENKEWIPLLNESTTQENVYIKSRVLLQINDENKMRIVCLQNLWPEPNEDHLNSLIKKQTEIKLAEERKKLKPIVKKETVYQTVDISGYDFAIQMPSRAAKGEIGLKSIIKCFGAWLKSKVKRGKEK